MSCDNSHYNILVVAYFMVKTVPPLKRFLAALYLSVQTAICFQSSGNQVGCSREHTLEKLGIREGCFVSLSLQYFSCDHFLHALSMPQLINLLQREKVLVFKCWDKCLLWVIYFWWQMHILVTDENNLQEVISPLYWSMILSSLSAL